MNRIAANAATLIAVATCGLLANPAAAQTLEPESAGMGCTSNDCVGGEPKTCTGDYVCSDPSAVATWPLRRWLTVRRAHRETAAASKKTDGAAAAH